MKNILILLAMAVSSTALAQSNVETINVIDRQLADSSSRLKIRRNVTQNLRNRGLDPEDYVLIGVSLEGRALSRNASATLIVGEDRETKHLARKVSDRKLIRDLIKGKAGRHLPGVRQSLYWDLTDEPGTRSERWQMQFNGDVRVRRLQAHVRPKSIRVRIPVNETLRRHSSTTVRIRKELRRRGYNPRNLRLEKVVLVAKSRRGLANAKLRVGEQRRKQIKSIGQSVGHRTFRDDGPRTYNRVRWEVRARRQRGAWALDINSNDNRAKVKAVIVVVSEI